MGERKVLNKYFPPDFDPRLVPKTKWDPFKQIETRMMIPFNIQVRVNGRCVWMDGALDGSRGILAGRLR